MPTWNPSPLLVHCLVSVILEFLVHSASATSGLLPWDALPQAHGGSGEATYGVRKKLRHPPRLSLWIWTGQPYGDGREPGLGYILPMSEWHLSRTLVSSHIPEMCCELVHRNCPNLSECGCGWVWMLPAIEEHPVQDGFHLALQTGLWPSWTLNWKWVGK